MRRTESIAESLVQHMRAYGRCVVAFSGGVDSSVAAKAAQLAVGNQALAVTAVSPSLASGELKEATSVAKQIGIEHEVIHTDEISNPHYVRNGPDRCYHCKTELYDHLRAFRDRYPNAVIVNGTNADDLGDYRPGLRAAREHGVRSPLAECKIDKPTVRTLAEYWLLPVWDKPAMPCLSSRIAYGEEVTPERLRMIDRAESFLRRYGFSDVRVRYHHGDLARIEVSTEQLSRLLEEATRTRVIDHLQGLGFRFVTMDMSGFRSGNLNTLIPLDVLRTPS